MNQEDDDIYNLDELMEALKEIKNKETGSLNIAKAFYCLTNELQKAMFYIRFLDKCIPLKYKKAFPKDGESPFFDDLGLQLPPDPKEYEESKKRMTEWMKKSKPDS